MSHFTYAPLPIAEVISERPTANLRWNNGILEQEWARETHSPHKAISHEWRVVPTVEHSPDANHHVTPELPRLPPSSHSAFPHGFHDLWTERQMKQYARETAAFWRSDVAEKAAQIAERYGADPWIARDIRALSDTAAPSPDANPHVQGRPDGHCGDDAAWKEFSERYGKMSREELAKGNISDFALANAQFMCDRNSLDLIGYQTAVKDRIRWLSIQLAAALAANVEAGR